MNYESLQLVNYDGHNIPSGYISNDMTARFAITYLKSIGASQDAVDKIKEVEVDRILYGITILKAAGQENSLGAMTLMKDGKSYGAGTGVPIPGSVVHALNDTGSLPEGWSMTNQIQEQEMQAYMNKPMYLYKNGDGELDHSETPPDGFDYKEVKMSDIYNAAMKPRQETKTLKITDESDPTKILCSMSYEPGSSVLSIDKIGKLPNLWANLLAAVGSFDKKAREEIETMYGKSKNTKFSISIESIPPDIRDEIMSQVLNPSTHYGEILATIRQKVGDGSADVLSHGLSAGLTRKMGFNLANSLIGLLDNVDFVHLLNENSLQATALKRLFPALAKETEAVLDENGKVPEDFQFTKDMFLINVNGTSKQVKTDLAAFVESMANAYTGMSSMYKTPDLGDGEKFNKISYQKGTDILMMPIVNMCLVEDSSIAEAQIVAMCAKQGVVSGDVAKAAKELVKKIKDGSLDKYSDPLYDDTDEFLAKKVAALNLSPEADVILGSAVKESSKGFKNKKNPGDFLEKYGPRTKKTGDLREPRQALGYLDALLPGMGGGSDEVRNRRSVNLAAGILIASVGSFGDNARDSEWEQGKQHMAKSLNLLNASLLDNPIHLSDLLPFAKTSPLIFEGDELPSRITYIASDHSIKQMDYTGVDTPEARAFAKEVAEDLAKLVADPVMTSERCTASTIIMNNPALASKVVIQDVDPYYKSQDFLKVQDQVAAVVGGYVEAFMDGPVGGSRDIVMAGGIGGKSDGNLLYKELNAAYPDFVKGIIDNPPISGQAERDLEKEIGLKMPDAKPEVVSEAMRLIKGGIQYDATMSLLSDPVAVELMMNGGTPDITKEPLNKFNEFQMSKVIANLDKLKPEDFDFSSTFAKDVQSEEKAAIVKETIIYYISQSAKAEASRRDGLIRGEGVKGGSYLGSVVRHSDSFEAVSSVGQIVAEMKRRPTETVEKSHAPIYASALNQEVSLSFSGGDTFTSGLRKNIDPATKGGQLDMVGSTTNKSKKELTIDPVELKVSGNIHQVADINASRQAGKALGLIIDQANPDTIYVKPVLNISSKYGNSLRTGKRSNVSSKVGTLSFNMSINSGTDMGADGNVGVGVLR